jgi:glycosyltransferase involved in cell wall biosynthesis
MNNRICDDRQPFQQDSISDNKVSYGSSAVTDARPLISIITTFLNEEKFIKEAIESVLAQTYNNWELILVDDGSTDESTEIAFQYARDYPNKVYYLEHEGHRNHGQPASRNLGIPHAKGEYIALLDADDVWLPEKLERQLAVIKTHPEAGMFCSASLYWKSWTGKAEDAQGDIAVSSYNVQSTTVFDPPILLKEAYPLGRLVPPCPGSIIFPRSTIRKIGGFEDSFAGKYGMYEDQAFLAKVHLTSFVVAVNECFHKYRLHEESIVNVSRKHHNYIANRVYFLNWLKKYLNGQGVRDRKIFSLVRNSLNCCHDIERQRLKDMVNGAFSHKDHRENILSKGWGSIRSDPKCIYADSVSDDTEITLFWASSNATSLSIHLNSPNGPLIMNCNPSGSAPICNIALDGAVFYLQDNSSSEPFENTLAKVKIRALQSLSSRMLEIKCYASRIAQEILQFRSRKGTRNRRNSIEKNDSDIDDIPPPGSVQFGSLRRLTPISRTWGFDRGKPIDRYYIERFLERHADDVHGHVLEFSEPIYTQLFGGVRVTQSDVMAISQENPCVSIIANLERADNVESDVFDCVICTEVLQLIYDTRAALRTLHRILKPGGVLLATFPGIHQIYDPTWPWYWNFTSKSAQRLFEEVFPGTTEVEVHGNVLVAISFLHGLATAELTTEELDYKDPGYEFSLTVRAVKIGGSS